VALHNDWLQMKNRKVFIVALNYYRQLCDASYDDDDDDYGDDDNDVDHDHDDG